MLKYLSNSPPPPGAFLGFFKKNIIRSDFSGALPCKGSLPLPIDMHTLFWVDSQLDLKPVNGLIHIERNKYGCNVPADLVQPAGPVLQNGEIYRVNWSGGAFLARCTQFGDHIADRGQIISRGNILRIDENSYRKNGTFTHWLADNSRTCVSPTPGEIAWFEACEKADKFMTTTEVATSKLEDNYDSPLDRTILEQLPKRYPVGSRFYPAHLGKKCTTVFTVKGNWRKMTGTDKRVYICDIEGEEIYTPTLYYQGNWAEEEKNSLYTPKELIHNPCAEVKIVQDCDIVSMYPSGTVTITALPKNHIDSKVEDVKSVSVDIKKKSTRVYL